MTATDIVVSPGQNSAPPIRSISLKLRGDKTGGPPEPDPSGPFQAGGFPPAAP
jgi:hypothetical protein